MEFALPDVGEGIDAAEIVEWHVAEGDDVAEDQPLADVQTDKAIVALPCPTTGRVVRLCAAEGDVVAVGATLAVFAPASRQAPPPAASPDQRGAAPPEASAAPAAHDTAAAPSPAGRPLASPAIRKLAREKGIDLADVTATGPGGRILRADVESGANGRSPTSGVAPSPSAPSPSAPSPSAPSGADRVVPLRGVRRAIARTLTEAWRTIPHVTDYREVDAGALVAARVTLRDRAAAAGEEELARALTITPLLVKIAARALERHPYVNASIDLEREEITLRGETNIGVATAAPDGLLVPVVRAADSKTVAEIALEVAALTSAARERRLTPAQSGGGTFTVNNYGGLGIWLGTPIIRPPEVANMGIGRLQDRPVARDGEVVIRPIVALAVAGDHRILDGHTLGAFVSDLVELMENPVALLDRAR